ncbi:hemicentin-1-like isoform X2 [Mizuhopecten yessoensis]|nr:hemicentin-1-like isoform X2 [Mizuhopecten yessoensis]XP_021348550.1 hemicentin-1-like isoform X2 [Mizuhopecten yessoensis]XP_021348551.1 hemicentin-1-like isoform X2 [Mizuhopecten yessoensis]XP_021348552.1 hemicentin-1-like isoform X2 [Mizuhopecten yessoensis]
MFATWAPFRQLMTWSLFLGLMHMLNCATSRNDVHPKFSGFDCNGKVGKRTVPHRVTGVQFPGGEQLVCCYPTNCTGGTIIFCTEDKGTDVCAPCKSNETSATCNYRQVTSMFSFEEVDLCKKPCTRKNAVPDVSLYPPSYTKKEGDDLTLLPTIYSDSVLQEFLWRFIDTTASYDIASSLTGITNPGKYLVGTMPNPYLNISKLELSDQGTYQLYVSNRIGLSNVENVTLFVTTKPIVTMAKESDNVDAGHPYNLTCRVEGNPTPIASGFHFKDMQGKVTKVISDVSSDGVITHTIYNASASDSGYYTCKAENSEGIGESTLHLTVDIPPEMYFPFGGRISRYDVGDNTSVSVWVTSTPIVDNLLCTNEGNQSTQMVRSSAYNITSVGWIYNFSIQNIQPQDGGIYICTASNRLGTSSISVEIVVNIQSKPPVPQDTETKDCNWLWLSYLTTTLAVLSFVVAIAALPLVHLRKENTSKNHKSIVLTIGLCAFDIAVCVATNLNHCSTSSIVTMNIIVCIVMVFSILFEIWMVGSCLSGMITALINHLLARLL